MIDGVVHRIEHVVPYPNPGTRPDVTDDLSRLADIPRQQFARCHLFALAKGALIHHPQFVVRHLEDDVAEKLKKRAKRHARSMEDEVRHILRDAVKNQDQRVAKLGSRIAVRFAKVGLTTELPELRGQRPSSAELESGDLTEALSTFFSC